MHAMQYFLELILLYFAVSLVIKLVSCYSILGLDEDKSRLSWVNDWKTNIVIDGLFGL